MPAPDSECHVDQQAITDMERTIHFEFFEGRSNKTPERYQKIRNYIIDQWSVNSRIVILLLLSSAYHHPSAIIICHHLSTVRLLSSVCHPYPIIVCHLSAIIHPPSSSAIPLLSMPSTICLLSSVCYHLSAITRLPSPVCLIVCYPLSVIRLISPVCYHLSASFKIFTCRRSMKFCLTKKIVACSELHSEKEPNV